MEANNNKQKYRKSNYLSNFVLIIGLFYLLLGICGYLFIIFLLAFLPVEYITYINELISSINIFKWDLFVYIQIFNIFFIILGGLFIIEAILIRIKFNNFKILGNFLSILQIWIFPIGTFAGYFIYSELKHV